jgi:mannose-1-phosphate guanylyltransferase
MCRERRCLNRERDFENETLTRSRKPVADPTRDFYPVILAGGRGTRFWPLSRKRRAKQLLALDGKQTMIQQTVARLLPLAPARQFLIITNEDLQREIAKQLRSMK